MSNQILSHVGNIAFAISTRTPILIPDAYIMHGAQVTHLDVTPSNSKYVPLSQVFDTDALLAYVRSHGIEVELVPYTEEVRIREDRSDDAFCEGERKRSKSEATMLCEGERKRSKSEATS